MLKTHTYIVTLLTYTKNNNNYVRIQRSCNRTKPRRPLIPQKTHKCHAEKHSTRAVDAIQVTVCVFEGFARARDSVVPLLCVCARK